MTTTRPTPEEAQRLADTHFVDRYDRVQLAALDRLDTLDRAGTPLVVPLHTSRVYRTEPASTAGRATITGPELTVTGDTVIDLLRLALVYTADIIRTDLADRRDRSGERPGDPRKAFVLRVLPRGRDVLDVAHRIGRLPR